MTIDIVDYGESETGAESAVDNSAQVAAPAPAPQINADDLARKIAAQLAPARTETQRTSQLERKFQALIAQGYNPQVVQEVAGIVDAYFADAEDVKSQRQQQAQAASAEESWDKQCWDRVEEAIEHFEPALPVLGKLKAARESVKEFVSDEFKNDPELNKHLQEQYEAGRPPRKAELMKATQKAVKKYAELHDLPLKEVQAGMNLKSSRPTPTASTGGGDDMSTWTPHQLAIYKMNKGIKGVSEEKARQRAKAARTA